MNRRYLVPELWSVVESIPTYAVSTHGKVKHIRLNRYLKAHKDSYGYLCVNLSHNGMLYRKRVHRLVAEAFFTNEVFGKEVYHHDGDKSNNFYENLRYRNTGGAPGRPKKDILPVVLTVFEIIETGERFNSIRECAEATGMDTSTIYKVLRGEREHHLGKTLRKVEDG